MTWTSDRRNPGPGHHPGRQRHQAWRRVGRGHRPLLLLHRDRDPDSRLPQAGRREDREERRHDAGAAGRHLRLQHQGHQCRRGVHRRQRRRRDRRGPGWHGVQRRVRYGLELHAGNDSRRRHAHLHLHRQRTDGPRPGIGRPDHHQRQRARAARPSRPTPTAPRPDSHRNRAWWMPTRSTTQAASPCASRAWCRRRPAPTAWSCKTVLV